MFNNIIEKAKKNQKINDNDYYNENNILCCGNCHEEKEFVFPNGNKVPCVCKCEMERMENEERLERKQSFIRNNIKYIDSEYRDFYLKDIDNSNKDFDFAFRFVEKFDELKKLKTGLYIYGDTGNGKTTIAKAIANEIFQKEYRVLMMSCNKAIQKINEGNGNTQENILHFKQVIKDSDLIVLDDFGASRETDYQLEKIYNLINYLYENKKVIIITTNISRIDLGKEDNMTKKRIFDRIIEMTYGIYIKSVGVRKDLARSKINEIEKLLKG